MALRLLLIRISQHFGTSMPQGGHPPHHSITSSARASTWGGTPERVDKTEAAIDGWIKELEAAKA